MGEGRRGGCVYNAHLLRQFDDEHTETCSAMEGRKVQFSSTLWACFCTDHLTVV